MILLSLESLQVIHPHNYSFLTQEGQSLACFQYHKIVR